MVLVRKDLDLTGNGILVMTSLGKQTERCSVKFDLACESEANLPLTADGRLEVLQVEGLSSVGVSLVKS